ncbi:MAG: hypothetical protein ABJG78_19620 [Cyclobacteriaceae bacterium]
MEKELTLVEKGEKKLKEWKHQVEELSLQLQLGIAETKDEFEEQKKKLSTWLDSLGDKLEETKDISKEKLRGIKSSLEELRVQAALGKAETEEHLKEQQKNITLGLHELRRKLSSAYNSTKEGAGSVIEEVSDQLDDFHTRFDLFRLRMHLGMTEAQEEWDEKKKELAHKLAMVKARLIQAEKETEIKWDGFSSEMSAAWRHFKKAFKN